MKNFSVRGCPPWALNGSGPHLLLVYLFFNVQIYKFRLLISFLIFWKFVIVSIGMSKYYYSTHTHIRFMDLVFLVTYVHPCTHVCGCVPVCVCVDSEQKNKKCDCETAASWIYGSP